MKNLPLFRNLAKNILAILLGLAISFILLEGLLRTFQPIEYRVKGNKIKLPRDKKYEFINEKTNKLDAIIFTSRNHLGFRGEMPPANFPGYLTILAVGGSTTACEVISDGKTWCDILSEKLKSKFSHVWLNNAGLDGASTYGHLILMEDYVIKMRPKVVLFLVGVNEIALSDYSIWDIEFLKKPVVGRVASVVEKLINASEVLDYARNFYRYSKARRHGLNHQIMDFARLEPSDIAADQVNSLMQSHKENYLQPVAKRLTRLIEISRENSIEPVFITQPTVFGEVIDPVTGVNLGRAGTCDLNGKTLYQLLELYNDVVRDTALKHGVLLIDLAKEMPKSSEYYYDTYHFTNAGCLAVAGILDKRLEPFLEKTYPQFKAVKVPPDQTPGMAASAEPQNNHSRSGNRGAGAQARRPVPLKNQN